jgi:hypothetical protein
LYVYFIQQGDDGPIKIGTAGWREGRLTDLQVGNPTALKIIGSRLCHSYGEARDLEAALHRGYAPQRIRGEWFESTKELLVEIGQLSDPPRLRIPSVPPKDDEAEWQKLLRSLR